MNIGAEGISPFEGFTWELLASNAGAVAATLLIVQYLKAPLDKVFKIPTRAFAFAVAFLLSLGGRAFGGTGMDIKSVPIVMLNALIIALTAMGAYEATFAKRDGGARAQPK